jgi:hypothetical protein
MMGQGFGNAIANSAATTLIILLVIFFSLGVLAMWGIPHLWIYLKPILHAISS